MNQTIKTFGYPNTLIREFDHWVVLIRPQQVTVGSLVLAAKSDAIHLGQLTDREWSDFAQVCQYVEGLLVDKMGAEKFNYLALMMKDPNVHFHFIPRYSKAVEINGHSYKDEDWPMKTELSPIHMQTEDFELIKNRLKS